MGYELSKDGRQLPLSPLDDEQRRWLIVAVENMLLLDDGTLEEVRQFDPPATPDGAQIRAEVTDLLNALRLNNSVGCWIE